MAQFTKETERALWTWVGQGLFFITLLAFSACTVGFSIAQALEGDEEDEATFMMECTYGWGQTPDNCRKILQGGDPPDLPVQPGC